MYNVYALSPWGLSCLEYLGTIRAKSLEQAYQLANYIYPDTMLEVLKEDYLE